MDLLNQLKNYLEPTCEFLVFSKDQYTKKINGDMNSLDLLHGEVGATEIPGHYRGLWDGKKIIPCLEMKDRVFC